MRPIKRYVSKDEIYRDFPIALRLILQGGVSPSEYQSLPRVAEPDRVKIDRYADEVANFGSRYPTSIGFFVEVPVAGDAGEVFDTVYVLLGHETGAEIFIPLAATAGAGAVMWAGKKVLEAAADTAIERGLEKTLQAVRRWYDGMTHGGTRIDRVEIRTANKGVLTMPFSDLKLASIRCLASKFRRVRTIAPLAEKCFAHAYGRVTFRRALRAG